MLLLATIGMAAEVARGARTDPTNEMPKAGRERTSRVDVGAEFRRVYSDFDVSPCGYQVAARFLPSPRVGLDFAGTVRSPTNDVSFLTNVLLQIAYDSNPDTHFQAPVDRELGALSVAVSASPWPQRDEGPGIWVFGTVGADLRLVRHDVATVSQDYRSGHSDDPTEVERGDTSVTVGPVAGVGFDLWFNDRVGARLVGVQRVFYQTEPDYGGVDADGEPTELDEGLTVSPTASLLLVVRL